MKARRPYLLRAMIDWIVDSGCTPYVVIAADLPGVDVPQEHVEDGRIVLNVSAQAVGSFEITDTHLAMRCRFRGVSRLVQAPVGAVVAVFARENGEGMAFEPEPLPGTEAAAAASEAAQQADDAAAEGADGSGGKGPKGPGKGPGLRVVK